MPAQHRSWIVLFCLLLLACAPIAAQVSASLSGRVTDQTGAAIAGANVNAQNRDTSVTRSTVTDQAGRYELLALPIGHYEIHATKAGFAEEIRTGIQLVVGQDATADLSLKVGKVTEQVKVESNVPVVNTSTQDISGLVGEKEIKTLPLNGRSYDLLMTLNPGIVNFTSEKTGGIGISNSTTGNNFAVSGNRPQQNLFLLNGVEFTGAAENNMKPGGASSSCWASTRCASSTCCAILTARNTASIRADRSSSSPSRAATSCTARSTNSCATARWMRPIISTSGHRAAVPAQPVWRIAGRSRSRRTKPFSSPTTKASARTCTRPRSRSCRTLTSRAAAAAERAAAAESVAHALGQRS